MPTEVMAPLIYAGVNGLLDKVDTDKITAWEKSLYVIPTITSWKKHLTDLSQH